MFPKGSLAPVRSLAAQLLLIQPLNVAVEPFLHVDLRAVELGDTLWRCAPVQG